MKTERVGRAYRELLEEATPEMEPGWEARASAATSAVRPAARKPWRWAMAGAGLMALVGLGFVPVKLGEATGVLKRAAAMASQATTMHMTGHELTVKGEFDVEKWVTDDGFSREEKWVKGELVSLSITQGDRVLRYFVDPETGRTSASEDFWPTNRYKYGRLSGAEGESYLANMFRSLEALSAELGTAPPDVRMTERTERSLWGGAVDVVEAAWTIEGHASISGVEYGDGATVKIRAEIDPDTNRLLSMCQYEFEGTWEPRYQAHYEWDVEIPDAGEFRPPSGTKLTRVTWWEKRADQTLAAGTTQDWEVVIHSIDVNRRGDLVLSLHRAPRPESTISRWQNGSVVWNVEAVDDTGVRYGDGGGGPWGSYFLVSYGTANLARGRDEGMPRTVTLTVYPYPRGETEDQSVTFNDIPLPPRQDTDDLFAAETEVIQY